MATLFMSYSRDDKEIVDSTVDELQSLGFRVWIDTNGITAGKQFSTEISHAIASCDFFLLFVSSTSIKSDFVRREVDVAHKKEKTIIPIRLEEVDIPSELDLQLAGIQWIEFQDTKWMSRLLVALGKAENRSPAQLNRKDSPPSIATSDKESPKTPNGSTEAALPPSSLIPNRIIAIFRQEFVRPKECDIVSTFLSDLANNLSLDPQNLNLQFALKESIIALASRVEGFRKICEPVTTASDYERIKILARMEKLARYSPS